MYSKLREIAESWIISNNPSPEQVQLSEKRYNICLSCEWYRETRPVTNDEYCGDCLCPLSKKIFSPKIGACDLGKWNDVDKDYLKKVSSQPKKLF